MKKYRHISVVELTPGSINSKRIYSRYTLGKTSMMLKKEMEKKLGTKLTHNGKIGLYTIYKGPSKKKGHYYLVTFS